MRVTFGTIHDGVASIDAAAAQFARAQEKVETGKRLQAPSDDPQAAMRIIQGKTEIGALDSYTRSGDTAGSRIAIMDTTFDDIVDKLTAAQSTTAAAMGSTVGPQQRAALAAALQGLRDGLVADLNVSFQGTYLFSGSETTTKPYEQVAGVWTYQGDQAPVMVEIGKGRDAAVTANGESFVRGSDATDLFTEMDTLIAAVQAGDATGIANGLAALGRAFDRAVRAQSQVGVDERGIGDEQHRLTEFRLASLKRVSKDEDANLAQAMTEMTEAQIAYQAALQAVATASKVSLLDYLR